MYAHLLKRLKVHVIKLSGFWKEGLRSVNNREELSEKSNPEKKEKGQESKVKHSIKYILQF